MTLDDFLDYVLPKDEDDKPVSGYLALGFKGATPFTTEWYEWPKQRDEVVLVATMPAEQDVYFVPYLYVRPDFTSEVLPTQTVAADLDAARLDVINITPSIVVCSSLARRQGYWFLKTAVEPHTAEALGRNLVYSVAEADRTSWPLSYFRRVPFTTSYKRLEPYKVTVESACMKFYDPRDMDFLPDPAMYDEDQLGFINNPPSKEAMTRGPQTIIADALQSNKIGHRAAAIYTNRVPSGQDRFLVVWNLLNEVLGHGMSRDDAYYLALMSPNNPYQELKYHAERELAKDVLRAEALVKTGTRNVRELVNEARRTLEGAPFEKKQQLFNIVSEYMLADGEFLRVSDNLGYYVQRSRGRPIAVLSHSGTMSALLDMQFGINGVEVEQQHIINSLDTMLHHMPVNGVDSALSYYNEDTHSVLVHSGRKDVYHVTTKSIDKVINGAMGVVFPWPVTCDPFTPTPGDLGMPWWELMFGKDVLDNVIILTKRQAMAVLIAWFMFALFRSKAETKPILLFQGQPGSGKTAMFKRIYTLLYGSARKIGALTSATNFDHSAATEAITVFDNVDSSIGWLPDRLAQSSSDTTIEVRKLYSNLDTILLNRKAMVGLTAHNPHFARADVADRMLLITMERVDLFGQFIPEHILLSPIRKYRDIIWYGILQSIQNILNTPLPTTTEAPAFRIQDFSYLGLWVTRALGLEAEFRDAIQALTVSQRRFALEDEGLFLDACELLLLRKEARGLPDTGWMKPTDFFSDLASLSGDESFTRRYRNPSQFGRHLVALQDPIKDLYTLKWRPVAGGREWQLARPAKHTKNGHKED